MFKPTLFVLFLLHTCFGTDKIEPKQHLENNKIVCTDSSCYGTYIGAEFINDSDIAHQFSNKMAHAVGNKLKELYTNGTYKKVDFSKIEMSTLGMGTGNVEYKLTIPFIEVTKKCDAFTSFDHVGGSDHTPSLSKRITELNSVLMQGEKLAISDLKITKEGLQEYWIQWKNSNTQAECD